MDKLNIVIVARNIFPKQSPRAFRATELAVELAQLGHNVTVYAILGNYNYSDFEKKTGVNVRNIGNMLFATSDSEGNFRYTLIDKVLYHALHRLIEFPDIELMFRIPRLIKKEKKTDLLLTIAYPHSIHWGAALAKKIVAKKKFPSIWISDCGDPYMGDPINKKKFFYFKYIEKWWGRSTDFVTIPIEEGKKGYYNELSPKIRTIPQGFNFDNIKIDNSFTKNEIPSFAYAGSIYPGSRDPYNFLIFLSTLKQDFKFVIFSNNSDYYKPFKLLLKEKLEIKPYIPREILIYELSKMDFLINLNNPSNIQLPSKIIDYLLTNRPIMDVSFNFPQLEKELFMQFIVRNYENRLKGIDINVFDIKNVTQKFIDLYYENQRKRIEY